MTLLRTFFILIFLLISSSLNADVAEAPAIKLPALQGNFDLSTLRGKVVYLDFWASWCTPCRKSFPWMNQMMETYKNQGLQVVAVNLDKERPLADAFLDKVEANFMVAFDPQGDSAKAYKLRGMPSSYLIGRDGKLYASHIGFRDKDKAKLEKAIQTLLKQ